ncbi:PQQ-dependent dehydrogenase, methanol/ethanol family [Methyloceanibacter sp.]|uniref:PQQ-dependent dehydrogenase, methanol/ethanol family n=1 Tax=Methyloceanibacter sp. TaxID=1965321 RepID=UPI00207D80D8|nr:PQQ-dependent dehydrogenase, methanol/ethanol family [Methyloceanibacter sp.]GFO82060.1 MAG: methanol dehydrogenase [Methyloceanibacter sp.]HML90783.1 PQQ-dependent dehydrogenase, methanol/ethanol family [Methyloceanibacter sp.]
MKYGVLGLGIAAALLLAPAPATAKSASAEIDKRVEDPNQWPAPGRDNQLTRHSTLSDINKDTVGKLQMIWAQSMNSLRGQEGQPVVVKLDNGTPMMYFVSGCPSMPLCNVVQALDLTDPDNPKQIWNYVKKNDRDESAIPRACCDTVNRGLNFARGKVIFHTLDGFVIALDGKTGKEIWTVKHAYPEHGETHTGPAMIAENLVVAGFGGDEFAARGRLDAYDVDTGEKVWTCQSTGSDKDVCLTPETNKANPHYGTAGKDLGIVTYPKDEWKIGGGAPWGYFSYDPELKLIYAATGNPGHWSPGLRCALEGDDHTHEKCNEYDEKLGSGPFDNKWSMTIFARKVDTGEAVWAYQMTPFDQWDYDGVNENILVDMEVDGKPRKTLVHFDRNGFAYVLDRADGTLLRAHKFVTVDWAEKVDLKTGRPIKVKEHSPFEIGVNTSACPSAMGGKDRQPCAIDPNEPNMAYCPTNNWCMEDEPQERTHTQQGTVYVFANVYMYPEKPGVTGKFKKFDVLTGETIWEIPDPYPNWGGALVTDGGLVFYGSLGGDFRAVDRETGKIVWSRKLGSGIVGNPITYKVDGKQYVSVPSGIGGWIGLPVTAGLDMDDKFGAIGATAMAKATGLNSIPQGGTVYTFRLSD